MMMIMVEARQLRMFHYYKKHVHRLMLYDNSLATMSLVQYSYFEIYGPLVKEYDPKIHEVMNRVNKTKQN